MEFKGCLCHSPPMYMLAFMVAFTSIGWFSNTVLCVVAR